MVLRVVAEETGAASQRGTVATNREVVGFRLPPLLHSNSMAHSEYRGGAAAEAAAATPPD